MAGLKLSLSKGKSSLAPKLARQFPNVKWDKPWILTQTKKKSFDSVVLTFHSEKYNIVPITLLGKESIHFE